MEEREAVTAKQQKQIGMVGSSCPKQPPTVATNRKNVGTLGNSRGVCEKECVCECVSERVG